MQPKDLTIAIVTRKRPEKLARCLKSISEQTIKPNRIIVVDNDAERGSEKICPKFKQNPIINYITEIEKGAPYARNNALSQCETELCAFIDDDCILDKHW